MKVNLFSKLFLLALPLVGLLSACGGLSESRQIPQLTQENVNSFIVEQKKIIRENEDDAEAHFGLSRGYLLKKEYESTEQHARIATRIDRCGWQYGHAVPSIHILFSVGILLKVRNALLHHLHFHG